MMKKNEKIILSWMSLLLGGLSASLALPAQAGDYVDPVREECASFVGESYVVHKYCIYTPLDGRTDQPRQILFHFPGYPAQVESGRVFSDIYSFYFNAAQRVTPYFVTVYSGSVNAISDVLEPGTQKSTMDSFVTEFLPWIKKRLAAPDDVYAFGYSMGGYNLLRLQAAYPGLFSSLSISCPAIFTVSPFRGFWGARAYAKQTGAKFKYVYFYFRKIKKYFSNVAQWQRNDILAHLDWFQVEESKRPYIYISANRQDELGFGTGSELMYNALKERGYKIDFESRPGTHIQFSFANQINSLIANTNLGLVAGR